MQAITKMWYDYLEQGKLMGLKCKKCGKVHFPPFPICQECSGTDMEWVPISGNASAYTIALVTAPDPWFADYAPYYYGYSTTEEGTTFDSIILGLEGAPDEVFNSLHLPLDLKMEIQKRDGYSYPVYRCIKQR